MSTKNTLILSKKIMVKGDNKIRSDKYKKNELVEHVLSEVNSELYKKELELISNFNKPVLPVIFIIGSQRSGTTLLMQLLAQLYEVAYPNNFISRFWNVPYTGSVLFKSFEKNLNESSIDLSSDLGYTKGLTGPHEFGYFWSKWFPWKSWEKSKYDEKDYSIFLKQLDAWQQIDKLPLVFKNIVQVTFHVEKINELLPNAYFIHIRRKPEYVVQSTYLSRIKLYGSNKEWVGLEPPEFKEIIKIENVFEQITAQVFYTRKFIEKTFKLNNIKHITIDYEELVSNTKDVLNKISSATGIKKKELPIPELTLQEDIKLSKKEFEEIKFFVNKYFK